MINGKDVRRSELWRKQKTMNQSTPSSLIPDKCDNGTADSYSLPDSSSCISSLEKKHARITRVDLVDTHAQDCDAVISQSYTTTTTTRNDREQYRNRIPNVLPGDAESLARGSSLVRRQVNPTHTIYRQEDRTMLW
jgi:hypothetical protein